MSKLSETIIHGTFEEVKALVKQGERINVTDEYGFTPLIQAAIVNDYDKAAFLLQHGANPNQFDVSGSSALLWAIDNNNYSLVELLLSKKANPNHYQRNGQGALFHPIMREEKALTQLLIEKGASLEFAQDYINAKLISHRFELKGHKDIVNPDGRFIEIDLEGFYLEFTLSIIRDSLERFINSYQAARKKYPLHLLRDIVTTYRNASQLRQYKHYNRSAEKNKGHIQRLIDHDLLLLPVSYHGHAITFVQQGGFLGKCDRGVSKMTDPIVIHKILNPSPLNLDFYIQLMFKRQTPRFMKHTLYQILNLQPYVKLPIRHQITGNCSWANVEASMPTLLFLLLQKHYKKIRTKPHIKQAMEIYQDWLNWDKDRAIEDCVRNFKEANSNARKASKAAILGAVLFEACDFYKKEDVARAKKILTIFEDTRFRYVIRNYINVFVRRKNTSKGKKLVELLKTCGVDYRKF